MKWSKKRKISILVIGLALISILIIELFFAAGLKSTDVGNTFYEILIRAIGVAVFITLIIMLDFGEILKPTKETGIAVVLSLIPCFVIALNNFPIISVMSGDAYIESKLLPLVLYGSKCLFVGGFEELAFRGFIFMIVLEKMKKNVKGAFVSIVVSSALFGIIHIVNLFAGASPGSVLLQVGYSTLIGGLASVVLIKTRNIWYCVVLHSLYNFNGGIVPEFGGGTIWTMAEVVFTAVVSVAVALYVVVIFLRTTDREISALFDKKQGEGINGNIQ